MRQREALFQDLANTMPEVVLVHRDRVIFANNAASALMGLTPEQLTGRPVTDLVRPAYRAMTRKNIAGRLAGEPVPDRYEIQLISGEEGGLWVEATGTMIDYRGQKAILSIARDVSYRKSIEANLGRGKQQAQITLESIGEGVITADTEGVIDYLNGAAEKLDRHHPRERHRQAHDRPDDAGGRDRPQGPGRSGGPLPVRAAPGRPGPAGADDLQGRHPRAVGGAHRVADHRRRRHRGRRRGHHARRHGDPRPHAPDLLPGRARRADGADQPRASSSGASRRRWKAGTATR